MRTGLILVLLGLMVSLIGVGCGEECVAGTACICDGDDCDITCGGDANGNCTFECNDGATCSFDCPGGGCAAVSDGAASITLSCPGDSCSLNCSDTATCRITDCSMACALSCAGADNCDNSCDPIPGACSTAP